VYLCGWQDGFQLYHVGKDKAVSDYSEGPPVNPQGLPSRLNDGRCDPTGERFICGGFHGNDEKVRVKVYSCRYDALNEKLTHEPILENVRIANSLSFSSDGNTMYFCDSPTRTIQQYEYKDGKATFQRDVWSWQEEVGFPDGSCVDEEGYIWNAVWRKGAGPGRVNRIDPSSGKVVFTVHIPDTTSQCTCVCLGGKDLDVLFITTASIDRDTSLEPCAGGLYAVKLPFRGRLESRFQLPDVLKEL
jgi:L-arabinonolactonase